MSKIRADFFNELKEKVKQIVVSNRFFYFILGFSIVQNLWYALTFQPTIFDEGQHLGFISVYSHRLSPFITNQPTSLDYLGEVTRTSSYLYYYLMSWPLRLIALFTNNSSIQIICLRLINIALFTGGLIVFRKLFIKAGASRTMSNLTLLFLILVPAIALLGGVVNYDNAIFLLSGLILLLGLDIVQNKNETSFTKLALFIVIGLSGSIMKFEFMAVFIPIAIYILYNLWHRQLSDSLRKLRVSYKGLSNITKAALVVALIISIGLFVERPVVNVIKYHAISPSCQKLLSEDRCAKNYTSQRDIVALANKPANFSPQNPFNYMLQNWIPGMITTQTILLAGVQPQLTLLRLLFYLTSISGSIIIIAYFRDFNKNVSYKFLLQVMIVYSFILAAFLYSGYRQLGIPVAITSRYLLPVMPIFILFVGLAIEQIFKNKSIIAFVILVCGILLLTQGGGIVTYIISPNDNLYWSNHSVLKTNSFLKKVIRPLVLKS